MWLHQVKSPTSLASRGFAKGRWFGNHVGGLFKKTDDKGGYSKTLLLPSTKFPLRANGSVREPKLREKYFDKFYEWQLSASNRKGVSKGLYIAHDGPPFANGDLHVGHALNKILKDINNRYRILQGYRVHYVPGWDCHGLPIELKALQKIQSESKNNQNLELTPSRIRKLARNFALKAVKNQSTEFQRLGILGDWGNPYLTMTPEYEARQIGVFLEMFKKGYIVRDLKPVHWSPSSKTALAEAELEYNEAHTSKSVYVCFKGEAHSSSLKLAMEKAGIAKDKTVSYLVWTTTPWTIPSNRALAVNLAVGYSLFVADKAGRTEYFCAATNLFEKLKERMLSNDWENFSVVSEIRGEDLVGSSYKHPLYNDRVFSIMDAVYVTDSSGTGIVHTAPNHGGDDFNTFKKSNLDIPEPCVDTCGKFTADAGLGLEGMEVTGKGNEAVIKLLSERNVLLECEDFVHSYPYDWRTKEPVIQLSTKQWFTSLQTLKGEALRALEQVNFFPGNGHSNLGKVVSSRNDWCISRQRSWGVPIPVFYHKVSKEPLLTEATVKHIQRMFQKHGSDCWWYMQVSDLLPEDLKHRADDYERGLDTMDVWFDSGSSWTLLPEGQPANFYLEGSDQFRGWFQSSLLTSVACRSSAPYKNLVVHGFVLDENGLKMSKSLGNTVTPKDILNGNKKLKIPAYGADILRLWAASVDYSSESSMGPSILEKTGEQYRKFRNVARFLIASLFDFNPMQHCVRVEQMNPIDIYMLERLREVEFEMRESFERFAFNKAISSLAVFVSSDLSSFYFETLKDTLYCDTRDNILRRSAQTSLFNILQCFTSCIAPVLPHLAEDIGEHFNSIDANDINGREKTFDSVMKEGWKSPIETPEEIKEDACRLVANLRDIRSEFNIAIESLRKSKQVQGTMEVSIKLFLSPPVYDIYERNKAFINLNNFFLASGVEVLQGDGTENVAYVDESNYLGHKSMEDSKGSLSSFVISNHRLHKCPRCWYYTSETDSSLCSRCKQVLSELDSDALSTA
eukprot:Nk52_evm73s239 gene=Nk52_evmTU73s239